MTVVYMIIFILVALFFIFLFSKLMVLLSIYHGQDNDHITIEFMLWFGLIRYKIDIPFVKIINHDENIVPTIAFRKEEKNQGKTSNEKQEKLTPQEMVRRISNIKEIVQHVFGMNIIIKKFLKKISIEKIEWHSSIGVRDAALTGILVGSLWAAKGGLIGIISNYMTLKQMPKISITPSFQIPLSQTELTCMVHFRIGNAIAVGLKIFKYWRGSKKSLKFMLPKQGSREKVNKAT
ncbi:hypothetical protein J2S13_001408 [Oikeobacillus pervagus]|uniref:DUF2953 domain-containing protein n=1 Tax=Oikeobacillus pervagus TaxID=1325931 RepID=A0AAJ1SYR4_9BACI|nr:DUF2953 domain-containing protein [Oikeobacillus pervagus]MDQ0215009.1 hypothetical protein [Oikeobacillus pervagus]